MKETKMSFHQFIVSEIQFIENINSSMIIIHSTD